MEDTDRFVREAQVACEELDQLKAGHNIEECREAKKKCLNAINKAIEELHDLKSGHQVMQDGSDEQNRAIERLTNKIKTIHSEQEKVKVWKCEFHES